MKQVCPSTISFPSKNLVVGFEGGVVYSAEHREKFYLIIDESAMADLLDDNDLHDLELVKCFEFEIESERAGYITGRGWKKSSPGSSE